MKYYKLLVSEGTDFFKLNLDTDIQHLEVLLDSQMSENSKPNIRFNLDSFLFKYVQNTRCLRILDLRNVDILTEAYFPTRSLYEIYLPKSVKKVRLSNAKTLRLLSAIGAESITIFDSPYLEKVEFGDCLRQIHLPYTGISEFKIPPKCRLKYSGAFEGCKNLKKIDASNSLNIPSETFINCVNLEEVTLPNHIKILEKDVFKGCHNLKVIRGGLSIEKIENESFRDCPLLEFVDKWNLFKNTDVLTIAENHFTNKYCNLIGTPVLYFRNRIILWSFSNHHYYLINDVFYPLYELDGHIRHNELVLFDVKETPLIEDGTELYIHWNTSCTKIENCRRLTCPTEAYNLSESAQQELLDYFNPKISYDEFCTKTLETIESLDIDRIIESYTIKRRTYWQSRPGRDDFEWDECEASSIYSDSYIETLLPQESTKTYSSGCRPWGYNESEENEIIQRAATEEAERLKTHARQTYSKLKHYSILIKEFLSNRSNLEAEIERSYNIECIKNYIMPISSLRDEEISMLLRTENYSNILIKRNILVDYERYSISALRMWL